MDDIEGQPQPRRSGDFSRSITLNEPSPPRRQRTRPPVREKSPFPAAPDAQPAPKKGLLHTTLSTIHHALTYSPINLLLIFVPAGIATAQIDGVHGGIVFGLNCVAVIPLSALLAHATESIACEMGDALGALINVTFGNAVELIIFM